MRAIQVTEEGASKPDGIFQRMAPRSWIPDTTAQLASYMLLATAVHFSFAFWPYVTATKWGWIAPWENGWAAGALVGLLLIFQFMNMIVGASLHRKLCETTKDVPYILGIAGMGFVMSIGFAQFSKEFLKEISGGAAIWYGAWGLAGVFMMKPGMDHILDIAQPKDKKSCDCVSPAMATDVPETSDQDEACGD